MTDAHDGDGGRISSQRDLPQALEPGRDLWPQIEARLNEYRTVAHAAAGAAPFTQRRGGRRLRVLALAAMLACVAVGVWIGRSALPLPAGPVPYGSAAPPGAASMPGAAAAFDAAYVSDPRYQRERAALLKSFQARLAALPPAARIKVQASLTAIARAKEDLQAALGRDPGNALLQELLVNTYQDEMRVLADVPEAGAAGRGI